MVEENTLPPDLLPVHRVKTLHPAPAKPDHSLSNYVTNTSFPYNNEITSAQGIFNNILNWHLLSSFTHTILPENIYEWNWDESLTTTSV